MGTVIVLGSLITDLVARSPRLPMPGESLIGDDFASFLGGKGINQAIAASRLGADVTLIGRVGTDSFADGFFPILEHEGINSAYVERDPAIGTGVSVLIIATDTGQNVIVVTPRANMAVPGSAVEAALQAAQQKQTQLGAPAVFLCQCETSRVSFMTGLTRARAMGMTTILNAAPIPREPLDDEIFTLVDILVVNEVEAAILSQTAVTSPETAKTAAATLLKRGPQHVLVTLGAQGSLWSTHEGHEIVHRVLPPYQVKAVDSTAAGDAFCGALAAGIAASLPMATALRRASAAGAITATRRGAIDALPTAAEIDDLLTQASS